MPTQGARYCFDLFPYYVAATRFKRFCSHYDSFKSVDTGDFSWSDFGQNVKGETERWAICKHWFDYTLHKMETNGSERRTSLRELDAALKVLECVTETFACGRIYGFLWNWEKSICLTVFMCACVTLVTSIDGNRCSVPRCPRCRQLNLFQKRCASWILSTHCQDESQLPF